jgi:hypothetical protein
MEPCLLPWGAESPQSPVNEEAPLPTLPEIIRKLQQADNERALILEAFDEIDKRLREIESRLPPRDAVTTGGPPSGGAAPKTM